MPPARSSCNSMPFTLWRPPAHATEGGRPVATTCALGRPQHDEIGVGNYGSLAIERQGRIVVLGRPADFAPSGIGGQKISRGEKRPWLCDIIHKYKAICGVMYFAARPISKEGKFIVVIAVDEDHAGTNALAFHLHEEIHRAH